MAQPRNKHGEKISALLDRDVYKAFKQIQLDNDLISVSRAMRFALTELVALKAKKGK